MLLAYVKYLILFRQACKRGAEAPPFFEKRMEVLKVKSTIAEYGFFMVAIIIVTAVFLSIVPMFQDGGIIKEGVIDYVTNIC